MNRFYGILLVYLTRPLCWLLAIVIATLLVLGWSNLTDEYANYEETGVENSSRSLFDSRRHVDSQDSLADALRDKDWQAIVLHYGYLVTDLQCRRLSTNDADDRNAEFLTKDEAAERLEQMEFPPQTQEITTDSWEVRQSTIDQLGKQSELEYIKLLVADSDSLPLDLSPLAKLEKLQSLNVGNIIDFKSLAPLQSLPQLQTITIGNHQCVTAQNMRDIAGIKSLRQLYLPDISRNPAAIEALSELKSSSLAQVFVAIPNSQTAKLNAIRSHIPGLPVRSSYYLPMRSWSLIGAVWGITMSSMIGVHFLAMTSVNFNQLTSGYLTAQKRVALLVMLVLISLSAGFMWICKVHPGLAITLSAAVGFGFIGSYMEGMSSGKASSTKQRWRNRLVLILIVVLLIAFSTWSQQNPLQFDCLLAQPPWWVVTLLWLLAIVFAMRWNLKLTTACRERVASGDDPMLSFYDVQEHSVKLRDQQRDDRAEPFDDVLSWFLGAGFVLLLIALVRLFAPSFWIPPIWDSILRTQLPMLAFIPLILIMQKWWSRVPYFATMIVRPPSRQSQVKQIFKGVAADFARAIPLQLAVAFLLGSSLSDRFGSVFEAVIATLLVTAGAVGVCYALTLVALTVRSTRWVIASFFIGFSLVLLFNSPIIFDQTADRPTALNVEPFIVFAMLSAVSFTIAIGATVFMWRRYQKIEWGSFLS